MTSASKVLMTHFAQIFKGVRSIHHLLYFSIIDLISSIAF